MIKYVLFDLDGTLLPMDQDIFVKAYFKELAKKLAPHGFTAEQLVKAVWNGMGNMLKNNGSATNEEVFWKSFRRDLGDEVLEKRPVFDEFYLNEFNNVRTSCGYTPKARETVELIRSRGVRTAVATLPVFPATAIEARLNWAGVDKDDMEFITSYENCSFTKPSVGYYREILEKIPALPEECLMVGNNVDEDMIASTLGMKVFLLTDWLINEHGADISVYPNGSWDELAEYLSTVLE